MKISLKAGHGLLLAMLLVLGGGLSMLLLQERLTSPLKGISVTGVSGNLLGSFTVQSVLIESGEVRITAREIKMHWKPAALLRGTLGITTLAIQELDILQLPAKDQLQHLPENLQLPLPLSLQTLEINRLRLNGAVELSAVKATLQSDGRLHRILDLQASLPYGQLTASGQLDGVRPFALKAQGKLTGQVDLGGVKTAQLAATAYGDLTQITLEAQGSGAGLKGDMQAKLTPFADFLLARLRLQANGVNPQAFKPEAPKANLTLKADLRGNADSVLEGDMTLSNLSTAPLDRGGLPLQQAHAHAILSAKLLQFNKLALSIAGGGNLSGNIAWQPNLATVLAEVQIKQLNPAAIDSRLRAARLEGRLTLNRDRIAQLSLNDGALHLNTQLKMTGNNLSLDQLHLVRGKAMLAGQGNLQLDGQRSYLFKGRLQHFDLAAFFQAQHSELNATLELAGKLTPHPGGTVRFTLNHSRLADYPLSGSGWIEFSDMNRGKGDVSLSLGDNRLSLKGGVGSLADRLELALDAPSLTQLGSGFGGSLSAHGTLAGSLDKPDIELQLKGSKLFFPGDYQLGSISAATTLKADALQLKITAEDYHAAYQLKHLQLEGQGSLSQHVLNLQLSLYNDSLYSLRLEGGLKPVAKEWPLWLGTLSELSGTGVLPCKLLGNTPLTLARNHLAIGAADLVIAGGQLHLDSASWTPQTWFSRGHFTGIGLRAGSIAALDSNPSATQKSLRLGGEWEINSAAQLTGQLRVARESGDWVLPGDPPLPLGLQTLQFTAHAADARLSAELTAMGKRFGDWHATVMLPFTQTRNGWRLQNNAPLDGQLRINVADLSWLAPAFSENLRSEGKLILQADIAGTLKAPRLQGQLQGEDLALSFLDQGLRLQQGQLVARIDQDSLHLDTLSFIAPREPVPHDPLLIGLNLSQTPGKLSATGTLAFNGETGDLKISASLLPLAQRKDRWIIASGEGQCKLNKNTVMLSGKITADAGLISQPVSRRPQLSEDIVLAGVTPVPHKGPELSVDAALELGEHFYLRASGLEARLAGQLSVSQAPFQPLRIIGTIAASDAIFEAYGQKLTVERGLVNFQGSLYDPGLNILARRKGLSVEAGVEVTGSSRHPLVRLVSTPLVPDTEKLSWIVLGRPPDATGTDSSLLLAAAGTILGGGSGGMLNKIKQTIGVDELSLHKGESASVTQASNESALATQIITVGKRLSSRVFLSYERGVTAVAGVTKLSYTLTPRINIVTQAGLDNAIDVFYTFSFD